MVREDVPELANVMSGVPQEIVMELVLLLYYINDKPEERLSYFTILDQCTTTE